MTSKFRRSSTLRDTRVLERFCSFEMRLGIEYFVRRETWSFENFGIYLMYFPKVKIKKELQFTQLSVLLTLHKVTLSDRKVRT